MGKKPRTPGMEKKDIYKMHGLKLAKHFAGTKITGSQETHEKRFGYTFSHEWHHGLDRKTAEAGRIPVLKVEL